MPSNVTKEEAIGGAFRAMICESLVKQTSGIACQAEFNYDDEMIYQMLVLCHI